MTRRRSDAPTFMPPMQPDEALAAIVGAEPLTRMDVVKSVWAYIKRHGLQDTKERRMINADEKMRAVFDGKKRVSMFEMTALVNKHLKPAPHGAAATAAKSARRKTVATKTRPSRNGKKPAANSAPYPDGALPEPPQRIRIRVGDVVPAPGLNTRRYFADKDLRSLATSMITMGQQQAVVLHDTGEPVKHLIAGERRYRAAKLIGDDFELEATIKAYTPEELVQLMLIENFQRQDLRPIEEARALQKGLELPGMTQRKLGEIVGRTQGTISNAIRLLQLPDSVLDLVDAGKLAPTVARDVLLPYMVVPEEYRTPFFEAAAVALRNPQDVEDRDYEGDDTTDVIRTVARDHSRSLVFGGYGGDAPAFSAQRHAKHCDCGSPEIATGGYGGTEKRCWNVEWWDAEQKRAKTDKKKREKRQQEKLNAEREKLVGQPVKASRGRGGVVIANNRGEFQGEPFDPSALSADTLCVVKAGTGFRLVCNDGVTVAEARAALVETLEQRAEEIGPEYFAAEIREARKLPIDGSVIRVALSLEQYDIDDIAREIGVMQGSTNWGVALQGVSDEGVLDVVRVLALRTRKGAGSPHGGPPTLIDVLEAEAAAEYLPKLRALIPWDIEAAVAAEEAAIAAEEAEDRRAFEDEEADEPELAGASA